MDVKTQVIVTDDEAGDAVLSGQGPMEYLAEKFARECGLVFKPEELYDETKFQYWRTENSEAHLVQYIGEITDANRPN